MGGGRAQMSTNITNEVVRMTFEGDNFEKKISSSLSALQKLKEHLKFGKVSDEMMDNTSRMTAALETMANKAETIWARVTDKIKDSITNKIMGALREVQDMTVNQLAAGWDKYAEKTEAVATLVGQGYDMDTVNKEMAKLNRYTDETSYQFTNMVQSIGKFTAAGQSLEDANLAMQGIANWAAKSGANATKASSAMYQLSQAMGKGALKLDDYKSVQNLGMDTQEFRQQAIDAAVALGTLKDNLDGTYTVINEDGKAVEKMTFNLNSFTNELTEGMWLTSDVMMKVFNRYGSAIDNINDMIDNEGITLASKAIEELENRNAALREEFMTLEGTINMSSEDVEKSLLRWSKVTEVTEDAVKNYMEYNKDVSEEEAKIALNKEYEKSVKEFADTFKVSSEEAKKYIQKFNKYTDQFGLDAYKMAQEAKTFKDAIDSVKDAASTQWMNVWEKIFGDYSEARQVWTKFANFLYDVLVDWLNDLNDALDAWVEKGGRGILMETFSALGDIIWVIRDAITDINKALFGKTDAKKLLKVTQRIHDFVFKIRDFMVELQESNFLENITGFIKGLKTTISRLFKSIQMAWESTFNDVQPLGKIIVSILEKITGFINQFRKSLAITKSDVPKLAQFFKGILDTVKIIAKIAGTFFGTLIKGLFPGTEKFFDKMKDAKGNFVDFLEKVGFKMQEFAAKIEDSGFIDKFREKLEKFTEWVRAHAYPVLSTVFAGLWKVIKIFGGVIYWFGGLVVDLFKKIPWDKIKENFSKLKDILKPIGDVIRKVGRAFKAGLGAVTDSMKDFNDNDERSLFQRILDALVEGFKAFKEKIKDAWGAFKEIVKEITNSKVWKSISNFLKTTWMVIKNIFATYVLPVLKYIWDVISGPIKKVFGLLKEGKIKEVLDLLKEAFQVNLLAKLAEFFKVFIAFFKDARLADIIKSISSVFHSIRKMFDNLADTAKEAKKAVRAWRNEKIANTLLKIVLALTLVIGLVFALSFITPERARKMGEAFVMVLSAALLVIGLLLTVAKVAKTGAGSLLSVAAVFVSIALCVTIIAKVIKTIGEEINSNTETMLLGFIGVISILALVVASVWMLIKSSNNLLSFDSSSRLLGIAAIIAALGVAVSLMAVSLHKMGEMDSKDFWQAIAGVVIMITALSASTWLLNVQKSQKGTMALIGLILVIKYMLIPMLRSIADNKFDLGQALAAVFIPLLTCAGYLFAMAKIANMKGGMKGIVTGILSFALIMEVISQDFLPALGRASSLSNGGAMIAAAISLLIMMATMAGLFAVFGLMDWSTIVKGAAGMIVGVLAMSVALGVMARAFKEADGSTGGDFLAMGFGLAVALIAIAGAMALVGSFAGAAITGASAIMILALAIALLTQAVIAFKKYVLGESIGDDIADVTSIDTTKHGAVQPSSSSRKQAIKDATKTSSSEKKEIQKRRREDGVDESVAYSEGIKKGMNSSKSKKLQNGASEDLASNLSDGLDSYNTKDILKEAGIDATDIYSDGITGYDSKALLKEAGIDNVDSLDDALSSGKAEKILEEAGYGNVVDIANGMNGTKSQDEIEKSANELADNIAGDNGLGGVDLSGSGVDLANDVLGGMVNGDGTTKIEDLVNQYTNGENGLEGLISGENGLAGMDLTGGGAGLTQSIMTGMSDSSLIGGFLEGATDSLLGQLLEKLKTKGQQYAEDFATVGLFLKDWFLGTDELNTGKGDRIYRSMVNAYNDNPFMQRMIEEAYQDKWTKSTFIQWWKENIGLLEGMNYRDYFNSGGFDKFYDEFMPNVLDKTDEITDKLTKAKDLVLEINAVNEELLRIDKIREELINEKETMDDSELAYYSNFIKYFRDYSDYIENSHDLSLKYEDFVTSITNSENRMRELYGDDAVDEMKGFSKKSIEDLVKEYKHNGTVLFDMGKDLSSDIVEGAVKKMEEESGQIGDTMFEGTEKSAKSKEHFDINSPSGWAENLMKFVMEGFVEGIMKYLYLLDNPLEKLQNKFTDAVTNMLVNVQGLLDSSDLEVMITPVIDMDNLQYSIGGSRFGKNGQYIGGTSYKMSKSVSDSNSKGFIGQANDSNEFGKAVSNKLDLLNTTLGKLVPEITIHNTYGIETIIDGINKRTKMNGGVSVIK